jgi:ribosomal protein S18 acetylase RimI-like enzyme
VRLADFAPEHLDGILVLCESEGWRTLVEDPQRMRRALAAPGVLTLVALSDDGAVIGFVQVLTDGAIQTYLALLLVAKSARRRGVGRRLLSEAFARSDAKRLDVLAERDSAGFYGSFPHHEWLGYRITAREQSPS